MGECRRRAEEGTVVFVGADLLRLRWHVTVTSEDEELFSGTIEGHWDGLRQLLDRYRGCSIQVVYEAGVCPESYLFFELVGGQPANPTAWEQ
jgi:hypothetical protein